MSREELEFRVLGDLAVMRRGSEVALGGRRQRLVLAALLVDAGRAIPADRLVDKVWGTAPPASGTSPLRTYIWELRRLLDPGRGAGTTAADNGVLVWRSAGYLLDIHETQVDSSRFERHFAEARSAVASSEPERALAHVDEALGLWQGPAFGDLATEPPIQIEAARLDQLVLEVRELHAELLLATGRDMQVVNAIEGLARAHPQRERLWAMLMTALYRLGRQGEALRCFQEARTTLIDTMGIEPGPALSELELAILRQDPGLNQQPLPRSRNGEVRLTSRSANPSNKISVPGAPPTPSGTVSHNLPRRLTSFVGRCAERATVARALAGSRMVTLSGSGGCGKTRLAEVVAGDVMDRFPGGVWFVDLAAITNPALVARAIAEPLRAEADQARQLDHLCRRIADQEVLLVLDNCDGLVEPVAEVAEELLDRCPSLHILATSREELRIAAEWVVRMPGLRLPSAEDRHDPVPYLGSDAVQLFVERSRSILADFSPTGDGLDAVAQACRRLDGIPLAIELAASLVGSLPVSDIAERLDDRFRLLAGSRRQGVHRHRTLRAAIDWSFDLLDEPARTLFVQLGVFVGDFTLPAAEAVASAKPDRIGVARGLDHLVRTSMIHCVAGSDGAQRYRLLETIREYARDRLEQTDAAHDAYRRHAHYYADFAVEAEQHVHGPAASTWRTRVVSELPNLRTAIEWAIAHGDIETGIRLTGSLPWFFTCMPTLDEVARCLDVALGHKAECSPDLQLKAMAAACTVALIRGELSRTYELGEESIALARKLGDSRQLASCLVPFGTALAARGDLVRAEACLAEAQELCTRSGDCWNAAWALTIWGITSFRAQRFELARSQLEEALELLRDLDDREGQITPLVALTWVALGAGRTNDARSLAHEAHRMATGLADVFRHMSSCALGQVELELGHRHEARDLLLRSIRDFPGSCSHVMVVIALEHLAWLAADAGHHDRATALLGCSQQVRERWQIRADARRSDQLDRWLDQARSILGPGRVELELDRGRNLGLEDAIAMAEAATARVAVARPGSRAPG